MYRIIGGLLLTAVISQAETHTLTLKQTLDRALSLNPDIALARLDEQKAVQGIRLAKDPFAPKVTVGSGLAYSSGFPLSIEGSAPSLVQARATQFVFNRQQSYLVAQARENARGAGFSTASKREEIAYRAATLYLDADRAGRLNETATKQVASLAKVLQTVTTRLQEGRELPIEAKRSNLELQKARQRAEIYADDQDFAERSLALVLGFAADDRVKAVAEDRALTHMPDSEEAAIEQALQDSVEVKRLESALIAKGLDVKAQRAARLPRLDLVAAYALLAKYNNYEQFFNSFQRNNGQIGISLQIPVLTGSAINAAVSQAETEATHLRIEIDALRNRIALDVHQNFGEIRRAETAREVGKADLELARDNLSILLAQMGEGRVGLRQVEEARFVENEKWIAFYDAQFATEKARLNLLRQTGQLLAELRQ
jgi:outer membrane protein